MPFFSFNVIPKIKQGKHKSKVRDKWVKLESNINGIVIIDNDINYNILLDNDSVLPILSSNYKCKNHIIIYSQLLDRQNLTRIVYHRTEYNNFDSYPNLPFCVGACVIGDIIFHNDTADKYFNIKKCFIDKNNIKANNIFKEFKNNYDYFKDKLIDKIYNHESY